MSTIRILLGIFCLIAFGCSTEPSSGFLAPSRKEIVNARSIATKPSLHKLCRRDCFVLRNEGLPCNDGGIAKRQTILTIARAQIGVREATGNNDGVMVETYLKVTKLPKGNPWCAAFVSWVFKEAGFSQPRTAWSPALLSRSKQTNTPKPADVLGIYSIRLKRIAHAGLVERRQRDWIITIEGNTNADGSREGDGVYRKWRHIKTVAKFADWVRSGS